MWHQGGDASPSDVVSLKPAVAIVAVVAAIVVVFAVYRWTRIAAWWPSQADMLIVIREATRRLLNGHTPYATYRSYDAPWNMVLPYGPALWGPFLVAQLLRLDFRMVTIVGELFIPVWCGVAAIVESARGSIAGAASWLAVLAALVLALRRPGIHADRPHAGLLAAASAVRRPGCETTMDRSGLSARPPRRRPHHDGRTHSRIPDGRLASGPPQASHGPRRADDHDRRGAPAVHRLGRSRDLGRHGAVVSTRDEGRGLAGAAPERDGDSRPDGMAVGAASRLAGRARAGGGDVRRLRGDVAGDPARRAPASLDGARAVRVQHDDAVPRALFCTTTCCCCSPPARWSRRSKPGP